MKLKIKIISFIILCGICIYSAFAIVNENKPEITETREGNQDLVYPIKKGNQSTQKNDSPAPIDLKDPENIKSTIEYDANTGNYIIRTKVKDQDIDAPYVLNSEEFKTYSMQKSMQEYWREKNSAELRGKSDDFSLTNLQFDIGKAEELFGPGGVQVKTQGSTELSFGFKKNKIDNPTLTERSRNPPASFDFDEKIQLSVKGSVGDKISLGMNYNTEASFDFDQKMIKLAYQGKEDEIIQKLEAGNVSMPLSGSLITGSSSLFGIKTQLKFGRLTIDGVVSQQESDKKTISLKNGSQTTDFDIDVDKYDENRHFFLSHYFHDNYDKAMSTLPYINSPVKINRVEVWVTNKRGNYDQARNIVAFTDLGEEKDNYTNTHWISNSAQFPSNRANSLYGEVTDTTTFNNNGFTIRNIDGINDLLDTKLNAFGIQGGDDYEKVESARLLTSSEYQINEQLGYISLKSSLNSDEVLAVAYEFTAGGQVYQVGEFASDNIKAPNALVLKMLKSTNLSPDSRTWDLMMKNIYALGGYQLQSEKFELNVMYQSDSTGVYLNHIPNTSIKDKVLLRVLNLDRLDIHNESRPDGSFDFVEGYTVQSSTGRIVFPVVEPFGSYLRKQLGTDPAYDKYVFQELYDSTLIQAQEYTEKNKFKLKGKYKASSGSEIRLNAMNIPRGSVTVTAGGVVLTENTDYTVDYNMGIVNITNGDILESGTSIDISLENQSFFSTQRKSLVGTHLDYQFNKDFNVGATILHLSEKPLTQKVVMGSEPISNTIWGLNSSYRRESQWLTNALDKLPLLKLKEPSSIALNGEFAQIRPGHSKVINNYAYIDDFESTKTGTDIRLPYNWKLASTPGDDALFPESKNSNDVSYGYNRALLAWYTIDPVFTRSNSSTPKHIRNDDEQLSNHFVREVKEQEIFPNRETVYGQSSFLTILNLGYYPTERGPYNLNWQGTTADGKLIDPAKRWGGIMRKLEPSTADFETANIEYIEFWMMDPFVYNEDGTMKGGDLYFNLGNVSEDILKDGKKSFESGLPIDGDPTKTVETAWGRVPRVQSMVYAFETDGAKTQDVGLDGLNDDEEVQFNGYKEYVDNLRTILNASTIEKMDVDEFSPLNDPAGDNYHYFLGSYYDSEEMSILDRYKKYNGVQNNSPAGGSGFYSAATSIPDFEDINEDNTLNEYERFYQYRVSLRPIDMQVGQNFIADKVTSNVDLANGKTEAVTWYQFKIPIREYEKKVGAINNFKSIRFIRMFLTDFEEETHLRFGSMELVRGEWRNYTQPIRYDLSETPISNGSIDVSAVNIEENANKEPIRYILPPGISRVVDPSQTQIRQENEQSMSLKVMDLAPKDARAVYKNAGMDMRQYKRLQMFVHAEQTLDDNTNLKDYELTAFIRLGNDHTNNFYEYEIPLKLTPQGVYSPNVKGDDLLVWPTDNMFDFTFDKLTQVKSERNRQNENGNPTVSLNKPFYKYDEDKPLNKITVVGNPSISDVQVIMIGIRNQSNEIKTGEVWVNELRLSEFNEKGGYAALANMIVNLSDLGSVTVSGRTESSGFGSVEQNVLERNIDDTYQFNVATGLELGKFLPEKSKIKIPFYYSYSQEVVSPKYDPLDQDILLKENLNNAQNKDEKDSIKYLAQTVVVNKSVSFSNVKVDIQSKTPQLYDPANFSFGYAYNEITSHDPETEYELTKNYKGIFSYNYNVTPRPVEPFSKAKVLNNKSLRLIKDFNFNYMPTYISYNNNLNRYYYEVQTRNLSGTEFNLDPTWNQDFTWNRNFDIKYDFAKSLKFTLSTAMNTRIDEPYTIVNKDIYPDDYEHWKDSVWQNLGKGGRPIQYQQVFTANYSVPINKIPLIDWTSLNGQYSSTYNWERGVTTLIDGEELSLGNIASNITSWQLDSRLNFESLYKKSAYLKKIDDKYSSRKTNNRNKPPKEKKYAEKISLKAGIDKEIKHRLLSNEIELTATDENGNSYPLKYKKIDLNTIRITPKEDINNLSININSVNKPESPFTVATQGFTRILMMVRNVSGSYRETNGLTLPGYQPETGVFGQDQFNNTNLRAPGYDFVFGTYNADDYLKKAQLNQWILFNDTIGNPVSITRSTDLQLKALIEPIKSLKIDLNANRTTSETQTVQFFANNETRSFTGTFSMTQAAIGTSLWKIGKTGDFESQAFNNFLSYRATIKSRIENQYIQNGDPVYGGYDPNSADVLVPAFLAAYTNKNPNHSTLDLFPSLLKMMPNWRITYSGLSDLDFIKKHLKRVNLTHGYRCIYNVGSYSSYLDWEKGNNGNYGYVKDVLSNTSDKTVLASQYDVGNVSISESFSPLLGFEITTNDNITFKVEYKTARTLGLNISSTQLIESSNNEWVFGAGYKIADFNSIIRIKQKQTKVKNDLTLRGDLSIKDIKAVIRKIEEDYSQPTSGSKAFTLRMTADYVFSEKVNITLYYNRMTNKPFISSSYPTVSSDFGVTFRFMLTR